jgi:hypothetical protein
VSMFSHNLARVLQQYSSLELRAGTSAVFMKR